MTPGAYFNGWNNISINGSTLNSGIVFEGQQSDDPYIHPKSRMRSSLRLEAIEQFTLGASRPDRRVTAASATNRGIYNFTSKSINQFHGSAYGYIENTAFKTPAFRSPTTSTGNHQG